MAIQRPDIYEHNNPNNAIVDSDGVRGGFRTKVATVTDLYLLSVKEDQLKEYATTIWVEEESRFYVLIDKTKINLAEGWNGFLISRDVELDELVLTVTLTEFQTLISNSELKVGTTYRVNGIDDNFCDGFFRALTPNTFDPNGSGLFRNPNYAIIDLWTNQFYNGVSISVGVPILNDVFTNGTQSFIWKNQGLYIANQDSLPNGTYTSGAKRVTVNGAGVWTYDVNDVVIFGNKHWKNINGNLGAKVDELNLNSEWVEIFDNLIYVVDLINYDIDNDWISERKDSKGNEISLNFYQDFSEDSFNYIKTFNWGKQYSDNNKIQNWYGVVCNLNFNFNNNTGSNFNIYDNTGSNFNISDNTGSGFYISENNGSFFNITSNNCNGFNVSNNTGSFFNITSNNVRNFNVTNNTGSGFQVADNNGSFLQVSRNTGSNFNITSNNVRNFNITSNTGSGFQVTNNTGIGFQVSNKSLTSKTIQYCDFKNVTIDNSVNISVSTILFGSYGKSIFRNSANQIIITYYNSSNVLVVANITD